MAKKGFKRIDCGYRCAPNYEGYGWTIEGDNYVSCGEPKCYIEIPNKLGKELEKTSYHGFNHEGNYSISKTGKTYTLGFFKVREAKKWAMENAR